MMRFFEVVAGVLFMFEGVALMVLDHPLTAAVSMACACFLLMRVPMLKAKERWQ
jgi:hypothetical protein